MRIVSLIPSATEIVFALNAGHLLVGRSHACNYPEAAQELPALTRPRFYPEGSSYEIDQKVKAVVQEATSVYQLDESMLKELEPDLILTQSQCEVCAVSNSQLESMISDILGKSTGLFDMRVDRLEDLYQNISLIGQKTGMEGQGEKLVSTLKQKVEELSKMASGKGKKPTAAYIEWLDPLMAAGHWIPELSNLAGTDPVISPNPGEPARYIKMEELVEADPDFIVLMPCGYTLDDTLQNLSSLTGKPEWKKLTAVENDQVYMVEAGAFFSRPGPRITMGLSILMRIFHPYRHTDPEADDYWLPVPVI
jgi:iron complex transport system substrate-binding protein